jgi:hypothetical protein
MKEKSKILEIGDVNGFNIEYFGTPDSLSINCDDYSKDIKGRFCIKNVNDGLNLNESFDYGMAFETIEHLHNPILVLNQLLDICVQGVFISIPYVKKTKVKLEMDGGHVFEFLPSDFKKICDHYKIQIIDFKICNVLKHDLVTSIFKMHSLKTGLPDELFGVFENFQLYYLKK